MEQKTYQATTMSEALAEVKRELGRDAVILNTRRLRKGGVFGWFGGQSLWEVQAAPNVREADAGQYVAEDHPIFAETAFDCPASDALGGPAEIDAATSDAPPAVEPTQETYMAARMEEIHRMVETLVSQRPPNEQEHLPEELASIREMLLSQDVEPSIVETLVGELRLSLENQDVSDRGLLDARLTDLIAQRIATAGGTPDETPTDRPRVIALIGPTGVGKTTTIAKLAANYKLRENKKVALLTIDTYRIAAVDQLRTYAEIIDVPIQAVFSPGELYGAVRSVNDADIVLIDTAGRSQNDEPRLKDLRTFIDAMHCDEVHLVISAAANPRVAAKAVERFAPLGANRILMTKLDEAASFGMILNVAVATEAAVSYVTTGQDVPDDIACAEANVLAESIVKGSWHAK